MSRKKGLFESSSEEEGDGGLFGNEEEEVEVPVE